MPFLRLRTSLAFATLLWGAAACGSDPAPPAKVPTVRKPQGAAPATIPGPPGVPAVAVAAFADDGAPMAFARSGDRAFVAFAQSGRLWGRAVDLAERSSLEAVDLGPMQGFGAEPHVVAHERGFAVLTDELVDQNHHLRVHRVTGEGASLGAPLVLPPVAEPVSWIGLIPLVDGALALSAVERDGLTTLSATPLDATLMRATGPARVVLSGAAGWHASSTGTLLAIGAVRTGAAAGTAQRGTIEVVHVDGRGVASPPVVVLGEPTAEIDVELAAVQGGTVVAWTDAASADATVRVAIVGKDRVLVPARSVAPPVGDQVLVGVAAAPSGAAPRALVAWENVGQVDVASRVVHLTTVGADGSAAPRHTSLAISSPGRPDLVGDTRGFAALTLARAAPPLEGAAGPEVWPTFVRLAADLSVEAAEPVRFVGAYAPDGVADATWGLTCEAGRCATLAASLGDDAAYFIADLPVRKTSWEAPAWRAEDELPPKVTSMRVLHEGPRKAAVRAVRLPGDEARTVVPWLSYHLEGTTPAEAPPRGEQPYAATLAVHVVGADGAAGAPVEISRRAISAGGIATALSPGKGRSEVVVAWVASDRGSPQVFVTKIDPDGKKLAQKKVTLVDRKASAKEAASADAERAAVAGVAVAHVPAATGAPTPGEGYVVAWVDGRDKNGELYAARVNRDLEKTVVDKRITNAPGDAASPSMVVRGREVFIAFTDAREGKAADVYLAHLDAGTLAEIDDDGRVYAAAGASRAPELVVVGDRLMLAWIEDPAPGDASPSTLRIGLVDDLGRLVGAPHVLAAPDGASITSFALSCSGKGLETCRGVMTFSAGGPPTLGGFTLGADGAPGSVRRLGVLDAAPSAMLSPVFSDGAASELFLVDEAGPDRGRLRRLVLGW